MSTEEQRAKWRMEWKKRYADPEYREKRARWARRKWQSDPEFRAKDAARRAARKSRAETA